MPQKFTALNQVLLQAIWTDDLEGVRAAVAAGADVNFKAVLERTPLCHAAAMAGPEVIQFLLDNKSDPNAADENGMTPLHLAISAKRFVQAESLLKGGADINGQFEKKPTPLHSAVFQDLRNEGAECTMFLLNRGARLDTVMHYGEDELTPKELALNLSQDHAHAKIIVAVIRAFEDARAKAGLEGEREKSDAALAVLRQSAARNKGKYRL